MPKIGKCALCHRNEQELQKSHLLPAGVYRLTRDQTKSNPNPVMLGEAHVSQSSKQISAYLLCRECETRFNENGERCFLKHCYRDAKQFRLFSLVENAKPFVDVPFKVYRAAQIAGINVAALSYFAISMFWRAAAHPWFEHNEIELGPYQETLRKYLMGETKFLAGCALLLSLPEIITKTVNVSFLPYGRRVDSHRFYTLFVRGVGFHLLVGSRVSAAAKQMCFISADGNPILRNDLLEKSSVQSVFGKLRMYERREGRR
jgi:hypothetical protein